jgi:hypothetical protein
MNFDPKDILPWIGAALAAPVALVLRKANGAVQKEELKEILDSINKRHDEHLDDDNRRFTGIFSRLDEVAKATARIEGYMKGREDR